MEDSTDVILHTENVCRDFKVGSSTISALGDVNIQIKKGKLTILKGRSGSGKTTLINILGALDKPTSGNVYLGEREITGLSQSARDDIRRHDMGFIFQSVALMYNMTAYENVELALRVTNYKTKNRKKLIDEWFSLVGMEKRSKHYPGELSGGEQQRVAIVRAVIHEPVVIFADEPTSELDTKTGLQIMSLLKLMIEEKGITVVMTTHDPNMMELADVMYTLQDGKVIDYYER